MIKINAAAWLQAVIQFLLFFLCLKYLKNSSRPISSWDVVRVTLILAILSWFRVPWGSRASGINTGSLHRRRRMATARSATWNRTTRRLAFAAAVWATTWRRWTAGATLLYWRLGAFCRLWWATGVAATSGTVLAWARTWTRPRTAVRATRATSARVGPVNQMLKVLAGERLGYRWGTMLLMPSLCLLRSTA